MSHTVQGTLKEKRPPYNGKNAKGEPYTFQNFIIEVKGDKYTNLHMITVWGEKIKYLDNKQVGDSMEVSFSIQFNKDKNHLTAYRIS